MRSLRSILNWAILFAAIAGIIYPAFLEGQTSGISQSLISLITQPQFTLAYFMRWLCVAVVAASIYVLVVERMYANVPLTVIRTVLEVSFNSNYSCATIKREQLIRANQTDVTAYFMKCAPSTSGGRIPEDKITMDVYCHGAELTSEFECAGSDSKGFEIVQSFGRALRYRWFMPLVPIWAMNGDLETMFSFLRNNLTKRTQSLIYLAEFDVERPMMNFTAQEYPQRNFSMTINFPGAIPPRFKVRRLKSNGVVDVNYENAGGGTVKIYVDKLRRETLRVSWHKPAAASTNK